MSGRSALPRVIAQISLQKGLEEDVTLIFGACSDGKELVTVLFIARLHLPARSPSRGGQELL